MNTKIPLLVLLGLINFSIFAPRFSERRTDVTLTAGTDPAISSLPEIGMTEDFTAKLKRQIRDQGEKIDQLQTLLEKLKQQLLENDSARTTAQQELKKAQDALAASQKDLATATERVTALTEKEAADSEKRTDEVDRLTELTTRQQKELETFEREKQALAEKLSAAEKKASELQAAAASGSSSTDDATTELTKQLEAANEKLTHQDEEMEHLKQELAAQHAQLEHQQDALLGSGIDTEELLKIKSDFERAIASLKTNIPAIRAIILSKTAQAERAAKAFAEKVSLANTLQARIDQQARDLASTEQIRKQVVELTGELAAQKELTKAATAIQEQLKQKESEVVSLTQAMESLKSSSQAPVTQLKARLALLQQLLTTQLPQVYQEISFLKQQLVKIYTQLKSSKEFDSKMIALKKQLAELKEEVVKYLGRTSAITVATPAKDSKALQELKLENQQLLAELQKLSDINERLTADFNDMQREIQRIEDKEPEDSETKKELVEARRQIEDLQRSTESQLAALKDQRTQDQLSTLREQLTRKDLDSVATRVTDLRLTDQAARLASDTTLATAGAAGLATASGIASTSGLAASTRLVDRTPAGPNLSIIPYIQPTAPGVMPFIPSQYQEATNPIRDLSFVKNFGSDYQLKETYQNSGEHLNTIINYIKTNMKPNQPVEKLKVLLAVVLVSIQSLADYVYRHGRTSRLAANVGIQKLDEITYATKSLLMPIHQRILTRYIPTKGEITIDQVVWIITRNKKILHDIATGNKPPLLLHAPVKEWR